MRRRILRSVFPPSCARHASRSIGRTLTDRLPGRTRPMPQIAVDGQNATDARPALYGRGRCRDVDRIKVVFADARCALQVRLTDAVFRLSVASSFAPRTTIFAPRAGSGACPCSSSRTGERSSNRMRSFFISRKGRLFCRTSGSCGLRSRVGSSSSRPISCVRFRCLVSTI